MATPIEAVKDNLDLKTLCNELTEVAYKYFVIGVQFQVPFYKLKEFEKDDNPLSCVINHVLRNGVSEDCPLSWQCIVEALESKSVDEPGLARKIAKKYCKVNKNQGSLTLNQTDSESTVASVLSSNTSSGGSSWTPPAVDLAPYFKYLSKKERENPYHLQKLKDETDGIERKFDILKFDLLKDLEKRTTSTDVVTILVMHCGQKIEEWMQNCSNLADVFKQMPNFISFYDYGPIKLLADRFASSTFKKKLKSYKRKFQEYAKRRICECPSDAFKDFEYNEKGYVLKTERDMTKITLEEIEKLQYEMNKILGHTSLHLMNVKEGCVELLFRNIQEKELKLSDDQMKALKKLGIISIRYGDVPILVSDAEVPQETTEDEKLQEYGSDSGIYSRETMTTSSRSTGYTESCVTRRTCKTSLTNESQKVKDLKDSRLDMIIAAESKPQNLPFQSPLLQAICIGSLQQVKQLVKKKENPMAKDINNNSCLHYAAELCQFEILKYLIEEVQCNPATKGWIENTVLHLAARSSQLDMVQYLVESEYCKLDPTLEDKDGHTALHYACEGGDLSIVRYLIKSMSEYMKLEDILSENTKPPAQSSPKDKFGKYHFFESLLSCACYHGNLNVVKYLIEECHCDPSLPQGNAKRALIESAVVGNHLDVVKYLASTPDFETPDHTPSLLHLAVECANVEMIAHLTHELQCDLNKQYENKSPLQWASYLGKLDIVTYLTKILKCDPNARGFYGFQLIHFASSGGHVNIVKYLIEKHSISATSLAYFGETPLHLASRKGHLALVKYLTIEHKCNPLTTSMSTGSSLHAAASEGQIEVVRYYVQKMGCDADSKTGINHRTPLHIAAIFGRLDFVQYLVEELGCDPASRDDDNNTPLHFVAREGTVSVARYLIEKQKCSIHATNNDGWNIVHQAAYFGKLDMLKYLAEKVRMDISMPYTSTGKNAVCLAAAAGHLPVVQYLMDMGSKHYDQNFFTPMHEAAEKGHIDIVKYLMDSPDYNKMYFYNSDALPLHSAITHGHMPVIRYFIEEKSCDPYFITTNGHHALHVAAMFGQVQVLEYLFQETKCDYLAKDNEGMNPLHHAARYGNLEALRWFVSKDECNFKALNSDNSYIEEAVIHGHLNVIKYFVEELKCCDQSTPGILYTALQNEHFDIIKYFVQKQRSLLYSLWKDKMPIHHAASEGKINAVKYLVEELKCDPMATESNHITALHYAAALGHLNVVKYLLEKQNCDPCSKNACNRTPLFLAATNGHFQVVEYLICDKKISFSLSIKKKRPT